MLHEFLTNNRAELIERCRLKVAQRSAPRVTSAELTHGIPLFLDPSRVLIPPYGGANPSTQCLGSILSCSEQAQGAFVQADGSHTTARKYLAVFEIVFLLRALDALPQRTEKTTREMA